MKNNSIQAEIDFIQYSYRELLEKVAPMIESGDYFAPIDELNIFWESNSEIIRLYISYISEWGRTHIIQNTAGLDTKSKEHFSFLLLGDRHIIYDTIFINAKLLEADLLPSAQEKFKSQIIDSISETLHILNYCNGVFTVLPFFSIKDLYNDSIKKIAERIFLSFFKEDITTIKDYFGKFSSIEEIHNGMRKDISQMLKFSSYCNLKEDFVQRYKKYSARCCSLMRHPNNDSENFFNLIFAFISQAIEYILIGINYNLIPVFQDNTLFNYVLMASNPILQHSIENKKWFLDMAIANGVYMQFNLDTLRNIELSKFLNILKAASFEEKLYCELKDKNILYDLSKSQEAFKIISKNLQAFYSLIEKF